MITTNEIATLVDRGADVVSPDGQKIGSIGQVYLDDTSGEPAWVTVKTGLFGTSESFVPLEQATVSGHEIRVPYDKQRIKDAPRVEADQAITPSEEDRLYDYYGLSGFGTTSTVDGDRFDANDGIDFENDRGAGTFNDHGTVGHDTSGPTTDDAMTRSEERLQVGVERQEAGRARLRKYIVTEQQNVPVSVSHEELRIEREPITDANAGAAYDGPALSDEEHEVTLHAERAVVDKEVVPVERIRANTVTVTENQTVSEDVRKEQIELDEDGSSRRGTGF